MEVKRDVIDEEIQKLLDDKDVQRGSREYLGVYVKAVNRVIERLSKAEKKEYEALAKEWTMERLPKETQIRYVPVLKEMIYWNHIITCRRAERQAGPVITQFIQDVHHDMGMKSVVLSAWMGPKGEMRFS
jgi:preprotein translocase subunit SecA